ncbi:MAG: LLM class F420-dependent oxidoreductase [Rhodospirillaceae bacterium]|nr:LLM class F420-dependent oxidoreductase [Rhodospirillaceae bacterium]
MKIGVIFPASDRGMPVTELARELEARGLESVFIPEHTHIPVDSEKTFRGGVGRMPRSYAEMMDPFIACMAAASATKKLIVGTGICLVPQHDPIVLAKTVASLDVLSGGRFVLGMGGGWNIGEMNNHRVAYETRFAQLREHVLAMKKLWTEEEAEYHGEFIDFDPVWSLPKPMQKPHPPLLLGGETDHTLHRVVEYCDGWFPRPTHGFDPEEGMARLRRIAEEANRDPASLSVTVFRLPPNIAEVERYAEAGIERGLLQFNSLKRDIILQDLDEFAGLIN